MKKQSTNWGKYLQQGINYTKQHIQLNMKTKQTKQPRAEDLNRHFSKDDIQIANSHMKRKLILLITRDMQIKTILTPVRTVVVVQSLSCASFRPHGLQHTWLPSPWLSPGVCSNSSPLSWWCHPPISSSVTLFFSCPQSFPESGSFSVSQLFTSEWPHQNVYRTSLVAHWKESACQCRRPRCDSWYGRTAHAGATKSRLLSTCSTACVPQQEKPPQCEARTPQEE